MFTSNHQFSKKMKPTTPMIAMGIIIHLPIPGLFSLKGVSSNPGGTSLGLGVRILLKFIRKTPEIIAIKMMMYIDAGISNMLERVKNMNRINSMIGSILILLLSIVSLDDSSVLG